MKYKRTMLTLQGGLHGNNAARRNRCTRQDFFPIVWKLFYPNDIVERSTPFTDDFLIFCIVKRMMITNCVTNHSKIIVSQLIFDEQFIRFQLLFDGKLIRRQLIFDGKLIHRQLIIAHR